MNKVNIIKAGIISSVLIITGCDGSTKYVDEFDAVKFKEVISSLDCPDNSKVSYYEVNYVRKNITLYCKQSSDNSLIRTNITKAYGKM